MKVGVGALNLIEGPENWSPVRWSAPSLAPLAAGVGSGTVVVGRAVLIGEGGARHRFLDRASNSAPARRSPALAVLPAAGCCERISTPPPMQTKTHRGEDPRKKTGALAETVRDGSERLPEGPNCPGEACLKGGGGYGGGYGGGGGGGSSGRFGNGNGICRVGFDVGSGWGDGGGWPGDRRGQGGGRGYAKRRRQTRYRKAHLDRISPT